MFFVYWCPFVTTSEYCNLQSHHTVQVDQTTSDIVLILYKKPLHKYWRLQSLAEIIQI